MTANEMDIRKATEVAVDYLQSVYGSLNTALFRIEEVRQNSDETKYYVICSLLTSLGSSKRAYYIIKVDVKTKAPISVQKGARNPETNQIDWEKINLPSEE